MNPLVTVKSQVEVIAAEVAAESEKDDIQNSEIVISELCRYIDKLWDDAKKFKEPIEAAMVKSLMQRRGEYTPQKLSEIREAEQPEIFLNITDTKCRNAVAWIKDILLTGERIICVEPTPIPELPIDIVQKIQQGVMREFITIAVQEAMQSGQQIDENILHNLIVSNIQEIQDSVKQQVLELSKRFAREIEEKIDDDWHEGGFYIALEEIIDDIVTLKAGILKGIIFRKEKVRRSVQDASGRIIKEYEERIVPQYERRSPFAIFPSPFSIDIDDGYLFDVIPVKPKHLYDCIGLDGYDEKEIRDVLREFREKKLTNDWLQLSDDAKIGLGLDSVAESLSQYPDENIFMLEFWGDVNGGLLKKWGVDVEDEDNDYSCCIRKIGNHIVCAILNQDPLGRKPYSKAQFQAINDSFWGVAIPELIEDCQQVCNACARSILSNIGFGALVMTEINIDRLDRSTSRKVYPGKKWYVTEEQMATGSPAVRYYQPPMVTERLINVYTVFSKIADEHSGVPSYAHGDTAIGGAGNTSSGLHQLIQMASRGIKSVIRNIDLHLIVPTLKRHYDYLIDNREVFGLVGDYNLRAQGTQLLVAKEQLATRKLEYLASTANPTDVQLIGLENRRKLLYEIAQSMGIKLDEIEPRLASFQGAGQNLPKPQTLDDAGNPVVGQDTRQFNEG